MTRHHKHSIARVFIFLGAIFFAACPHPGPKTILRPAPPPPKCIHSPGAEGAALNRSCDPCVKMICDAMSECCDPTLGWSNKCVTQVMQTCSQLSDCSQVNQTHTLSYNKQSCQCTRNVCGDIPSCCTLPPPPGAWDQQCVNQAALYPNDCAH